MIAVKRFASGRDHAQGPGERVVEFFKGHG